MPATVLDRILAAACYLGLAPLTRFWRAPFANPFLQHHMAQSMAAFFCLLLVSMAYFGFFWIVLGVMLMLFPAFFQHLAERFGWLSTVVDYALYVPVIGLVALWVTLLGLALKGSVWRVPLLSKLSRRPRVVRFSFFANSLLFALIPLVTVLTVYATSLTGRNSDGAAVYFLYDEGIQVPRWGYAMGLSRISLQAEKNWGKGCIVLDRLTQETLRAALASGKVVILATHGDQGYAATYFAAETLCVGPPPMGAVDEMKSHRYLQTCILPYDRESWDRLKAGKWDKWDNVPANSQLQLAYVFACNGGTKAAEWEEHLAPARVITYNRMSVVWDHALWFAFTGPQQLKLLK